MSEVLAFDLYGTLVDLGSQADALAGYVDDPAAIAQAWRRHQLEISWLLSMMSGYEDWTQVTRYALQASLDEARIELAEVEQRQVLERAAAPRLYDDTAGALAALSATGHELAILSNGTRAQLEAVTDQTGIAGLFAELISVDEIGVFKPAAAVYRHAAGRLGRPIGDVWLVSGNAFDAAGGKAAGMRIAKLEREQALRYPFAPPPDLVISGLDELTHLLSDRKPTPINSPAGPRA